jgi:hypothetical protein
MRVLAWCMLLAAMIFAAASNRISDNDFDQPSGGIEMHATTPNIDAATAL